MRAPLSSLVTLLAALLLDLPLLVESGTPQLIQFREGRSCDSTTPKVYVREVGVCVPESKGYLSLLTLSQSSCASGVTATYKVFPGSDCTGTPLSNATYTIGQCQEKSSRFITLGCEEDCSPYFSEVSTLSPDCDPNMEPAVSNIRLGVCMSYFPISVISAEKFTRSGDVITYSRYNDLDCSTTPTSTTATPLNVCQLDAFGESFTYSMYCKSSSPSTTTAGAGVSTASGASTSSRTTPATTTATTLKTTDASSTTTSTEAAATTTTTTTTTATTTTTTLSTTATTARPTLNGTGVYLQFRSGECDAARPYYFLYEVGRCMGVNEYERRQVTLLTDCRAGAIARFSIYHNYNNNCAGTPWRYFDYVIGTCAKVDGLFTTVTCNPDCSNYMRENYFRISNSCDYSSVPWDWMNRLDTCMSSSPYFSEIFVRGANTITHTQYFSPDCTGTSLASPVQVHTVNVCYSGSTQSEIRTFLECQGGVAPTATSKTTAQGPTTTTAAVATTNSTTTTATTTTTPKPCTTPCSRDCSSDDSVCDPAVGSCTAVASKESSISRRGVFLKGINVPLEVSATLSSPGAVAIKNITAFLVDSKGVKTMPAAVPTASLPQPVCDEKSPMATNSFKIPLASPARERPEVYSVRVQAMINSSDPVFTVGSVEVVEDAWLSTAIGSAFVVTDGAGGSWEASVTRQGSISKKLKAPLDLWILKAGAEYGISVGGTRKVGWRSTGSPIFDPSFDISLVFGDFTVDVAGTSSIQTEGRRLKTWTLTISSAASRHLWDSSVSIPATEFEIGAGLTALIKFQNTIVFTPSSSPDTTTFFGLLKDSPFTATSGNKVDVEIGLALDLHGGKPGVLDLLGSVVGNVGMSLDFSAGDVTLRAQADVTVKAAVFGMTYTLLEKSLAYPPTRKRRGAERKEMAEPVIGEPGDAHSSRTRRRESSSPAHLLLRDSSAFAAVDASAKGSKCLVASQKYDSQAETSAVLIDFLDAAGNIATPSLGIPVGENAGGDFDARVALLSETVAVVAWVRFDDEAAKSSSFNPLLPEYGKYASVFWATVDVASKALVAPPSKLSKSTPECSLLPAVAVNSNLESRSAAAVLLFVVDESNLVLSTGPRKLYFSFLSSEPQLLSAPLLALTANIVARPAVALQSELVVALLPMCEVSSSSSTLTRHAFSVFNNSSGAGVWSVPQLLSPSGTLQESSPSIAGVKKGVFLLGTVVNGTAVVHVLDAESRTLYGPTTIRNVSGAVTHFQLGSVEVVHGGRAFVQYSVVVPLSAAGSASATLVLGVVSVSLSTLTARDEFVLNSTNLGIAAQIVHYAAMTLDGGKGTRSVLQVCEDPEEETGSILRTEVVGSTGYVGDKGESTGETETSTSKAFPLTLAVAIAVPAGCVLLLIILVAVVMRARKGSKVQAARDAITFNDEKMDTTEL